MERFFIYLLIIFPTSWKHSAYHLLITFPSRDGKILQNLHFCWLFSWVGKILHISWLCIFPPGDGKILHICWLFSFHEMQRFCTYIDYLPSIKWKDSVEYFPSMSWKDSEYHRCWLFSLHDIERFWISVDSFLSMRCKDSPNLLIIFSPWDGKILLFCWLFLLHETERHRITVNSFPLSIKTLYVYWFFPS